MYLEYKKYEIENNVKVNKKIIHISDIHYSEKYNKKRLSLLFNEIKKTNPNYICITGDLIDDYSITKNIEFKYFENWLKDLSKICKIIIIIGNHEYIKKENKKYIFNNDIEWLNNIKNENIIVLNNQIYSDENIDFIGYNPYFKNINENNMDIIKQINNIDNLIKKSKKDFKIFMIHTPFLLLRNDNYRKIKNFKELNIILSGHTHGGMLPSFIKGNNGIISPERELFPKNVRGKIDLDNNSIIISTGVIKLSKKSKISILNDIYGTNINEIVIKDI